MSTIDREEAIRIIASYPGPVDKSVVRRLLTQMPNLQPTCNQLATDCISRQAAIDALMDAMDRPKHADFLYTDEICRTLKSLPSAQPERKSGEWLPQDHNKRTGYVTTTVYYYPKCSECGHTGNYGMNFCPNCGADMRGEQDG